MVGRGLSGLKYWYHLLAGSGLNRYIHAVTSLPCSSMRGQASSSMQPGPAASMQDHHVATAKSQHIKSLLSLLNHCSQLLVSMCTTGQRALAALSSLCMHRRKQQQGTILIATSIQSSNCFSDCTTTLLCMTPLLQFLPCPGSCQKKCVMLWPASAPSTKVPCRTCLQRF